LLALCPLHKLRGGYLLSGVPRCPPLPLRIADPLPRLRTCGASSGAQADRWSVTRAQVGDLGVELIALVAEAD
jgi:hypothetical protein